MLYGVSCEKLILATHCDSEVVKCVTSYGIGVGRMISPIGFSAKFCSTKCGFILRDIRVVSPLMCLQNFFS